MIVMLRSMKASGWLVLLAFVPLVNLVFALWFLFATPARHGRTRLWGVCFLIPVLGTIGLWVYAYTLDGDSRPRNAGLAGYHVPPGAATGGSGRR